MSLAMTGLIIVQAYWINNAIDVKEKQFSQIVNRALSDIVSEIQQQETVFQIINEIEPIDTSNNWEEYSTVHVEVSASEYLQEFTIRSGYGNDQNNMVNNGVKIYQRSTSKGDHRDIAVITEDSFLHENIPGIIIDSSGIQTITWISPERIREKMKQELPQGYTLESAFNEEAGTLTVRVMGSDGKEKKKDLIKKLVKDLKEELKKDMAPLSPQETART